MSARPVIAVLLCSHNGGPYIAAQLDSLAAQTRLPDYLEIHDWGSNDDSTTQITRWRGEHDLVTEFYQHGGVPGPSKSFLSALAGLLVRRPDVSHVLFCDQDDLWDSDRLALYSESLAEQGPCDLLFSDVRLIDGGGQALAESFYKRRGSPYRWPVALECAQLYLVNPAIGMTMMLSRRLAQLLAEQRDGPWPMHDWGAVMLCRQYAMDSRFLPKVLGSYRQHGGNLRGAPGAGKLGSSFVRLRERLASLRALRRWCQGLAAPARGGEDIPRGRWQALRVINRGKNLRWWYQLLLGTLVLLLWPRESDA